MRPCTRACLQGGLRGCAIHLEGGKHGRRVVSSLVRPVFVYVYGQGGQRRFVTQLKGGNDGDFVNLPVPYVSFVSVLYIHVMSSNFRGHGSLCCVQRAVMFSLSTQGVNSFLL